MRRRLPGLDQSRILSACPARWEDMRGEGATRFCEVCSRDVHDVAALDREAAEMLLRSPAPVCARVTRDADGRVVTRESRAGVTAALALMMVAACGQPEHEGATRAVHGAEVISATRSPDVRAAASAADAGASAASTGPSASPASATSTAASDTSAASTAASDTSAAFEAFAARRGSPAHDPDAPTSAWGDATDGGDDMSARSLGMWGPGIEE